MVRVGDTLEFKWTTSRGRETYGWNVCTLYVNDVKASRCNGGGYDMKGTCLGSWIAKTFPNELKKLNQAFYGLTWHNPNYDLGKAEVEGETVEQREKEGKSLGLERYQAFYSASSKVPTERHTVPRIDGACGMSSVETILRAIGYKLHCVKETSARSMFTLEQVSS